MLLRWSLNIASVVSMILGIAILGIWIDTHWRSYETSLSRARFESTTVHETSLDLRMLQGGLMLLHTSVTRHDDSSAAFVENPQDQSWRWSWNRHPAWDDYTLKTFDWYRAPYEDASVTEMRTLSVLPDWFACSATMLLPVVSIVRWRRGRRRLARRRQGQCIQCGYDLRASKDRCPECGSAV